MGGIMQPKAFFGVQFCKLWLAAGRRPRKYHHRSTTDEHEEDPDFLRRHGGDAYIGLCRGDTRTPVRMDDGVGRGQEVAWSVADEYRDRAEVMRQQERIVAEIIRAAGAYRWV